LGPGGQLTASFQGKEKGFELRRSHRRGMWQPEKTKCPHYTYCSVIPGEGRGKEQTDTTKEGDF